MARVSIDNDNDLRQAEDALDLIETAIYGMPGWLVDDSGIDVVQKRIEKAIERYERQQERLNR